MPDDPSSNVIRFPSPVGNPNPQASDNEQADQIVQATRNLRAAIAKHIESESD
jgi:hypothetical protein